jgi:hypothetical protein
MTAARVFVLCGVLQSALIWGQTAFSGLPTWDTETQVWVADAHKRVYPGSFGRDRAGREIKLEAWRNEFVVSQLGLRANREVKGVRVKAGELRLTGGSSSIPASAFRIRYPALIPVDENGQYTPDPLYERPAIDLLAHQSQGVWIDFRVPRDAAPGHYVGTFRVENLAAKPVEFHVSVNVLPLTLPDPPDYRCYLNILVDPSSVARFNKLPLWGEEHWRQLEAYVEDLAAHGQKTITAFIVEDPWQGDTGFAVRSLVQWKHDGEWTLAGGTKLQQDFTSFDRFVEMCLKAGIRDHIEAWSPLVQPGTDHSVVTYIDTRTGQSHQLRLPAGSAEYRAVWGAFAANFEQHLRQKGWLDKTYLAFDEISTKVLDQVIPFYEQTAPGLKLMVSGGDDDGKYTSQSRESALHYGYTTPGSGITLPDIEARRKAGKRTLLYTATTPIYPNTFIFSDPLESRYLIWAIWKWNYDGYIRWAWNFWPATLWDQPQYKWPSGDMFLVYPGPHGPVDSMRWEMLRKGIEDYECLATVRQLAAELKASGRNPQLVEEAATVLEKAVDLATQQFDRTKIPRDPIPARIGEARAMVNALAVRLSQARQ